MWDVSLNNLIHSQCWYISYCTYFCISCDSKFPFHASQICTSQRQAFSEPWQTFKMEHFAKIINGWKPLTLDAKMFDKAVYVPLTFCLKDFFEICIYFTSKRCIIQVTYYYNYIFASWRIHFTFLNIPLNKRLIRFSLVLLIFGDAVSFLSIKFIHS